MAEVLVLVEHLDGNVKKVTTELLTKARQLGESSVVYVGAGFDNAKARLAEFGAAKVYVAADEELSKYVVAPKVAWDSLLPREPTYRTQARVLTPTFPISMAKNHWQAGARLSTASTRQAERSCRSSGTWA